MLISSSPSSIGTRRIATILSLVAAVIYFMIAFGFVPAGFEAPPAPVMFVAGMAYLVGGLLILRAERRLLLVGAILNVLVLVIFAISFFAGKSTVDALSVIGKAAQIGLEIALIMLLRRSAAQ